MDPIKYFYPLMLVVGYMTSRRDIKCREIVNGHLGFGLLVGAGIYVALFVMGVYRPPFFFFAANMAVSVAVAYGLYCAELWSAGDGKIFILFSFLTVSSPYGHVLLLPCILLFLNSMFLAFCAVLVVDFKYLFLHLKKIRATLFDDFRDKIFISLLILFSITWAFWNFIPALRSVSPVLFIVILYFVYAGIYRAIMMIKPRRMLLLVLFGAGLAFHMMFIPEDFFSVLRLLRYLSTTLVSSLLFTFFQGAALAYKEEHMKNRLIAFAPIVFLGAVTMESPLIFLVSEAFYLLRAKT